MNVRLEPDELGRLARRFDGPHVLAIALLGSHARGDAGPFSDVDLVRILSDSADGTTDVDGSHLIDGRLVVVSSQRRDAVESWFTDPKVIVDVLAGLRDAKIVVDRTQTFAAIQARAHGFVWDENMQAAADAHASRGMVGWAEEVHKGLEGLRRNDIGRLLNARFGLSWGLASLVRVQRGVLVRGDNDFFDAVTVAVGQESTWSHLLGTAFGVMTPAQSAPSLREQVAAGLRLYAETARLLDEAIQPRDRALIEHTVELIRVWETEQEL